jgi:hypothetical protein
MVIFFGVHVSFFSDSMIGTTRLPPHLLTAGERSLYGSDTTC